MGTNESEICAGISERGETHNKKFISLSLSLQVKHGFKAHACSMWYYGHIESIMESPDTAVYIFPSIYGDLRFIHATY